jgi:parallel beta-helix repeat protein
LDVGGNKLNKKLICIGVINLFLLSSIVSLAVGTKINKEVNEIQPIKGIDLHVSGTITVDDDRNECPDADYTKIQDAIDNASNGDTIYVYNGIYYEKLKVNKTVYLQGINNKKSRPNIEGNNTGTIIKITAENCIVDNFIISNTPYAHTYSPCVFIDAKNCTIRNNELRGECHYGIYLGYRDRANNAKIINNTIDDLISGIYSYSDPYGGSNNINISGNIIRNCLEAIRLDRGENDIINKNQIISNSDGIFIMYGGDIKITYNNISDNSYWGIKIMWTNSRNYVIGNTICSNGGTGISYSFPKVLYHGDIISDNIICMNGDCGIFLDRLCHNEITNNTISDNQNYGLYNFESGFNKIYHNNFINSYNAYDCGKDDWDNGYPSGGNYWSDYTGQDSDGDGIGDTPYRIKPFPLEQKDRYPFMKPNGWVNHPPNPPSISGPSSGKYGEEYEYAFTANDPDGDQVYYLIDWGDRTTLDWFGVFDSGEEINIVHTWNQQGAYIIKAKVRDTYGVESDWTTLPVTMPKNKQSHKYLLFEYFEWHPNNFPLLKFVQRIIG